MGREKIIREYGLTAAMVEMLTYQPLDGVMPPGPTRAALMRHRGLVANRDSGRFGRLTEAGREVALALRDNR